MTHNEIVARVQEIVEQNVRAEEKMQAVCRLLHDELDGYDWVGFYLVDEERPGELVLGPYVGEPTEHTRILFGEGICGQAAERDCTVVVDDVTQETNYLACSPHVRSEIVLPLYRHGQLAGELDIDSHTPARFGSDDRLMLEEICLLLTDRI